MNNLLSLFTSQHFMIQLVNQPSRRAGNVFDFWLISNGKMFPPVESTPTAPNSSHHFIRTSTHSSSSIQFPNHELHYTSVFDKVNSFSEKTDLQKINLTLETINWISLFDNITFDQTFEEFMKTCENIALKSCPPKLKKMSKNNSTIPRHWKIPMRNWTKLRKIYHNENNQI